MTGEVQKYRAYRDRKPTKVVAPKGAGIGELLFIVSGAVGILYLVSLFL